MKKIISLMLAVLMMVSVFSSCSKEPENEVQETEKENEIVVSSLQKTITAIIYDNGEDEEFWNAVKTSFESANNSITVNMIVSKDAAYEVRDRILAGNSPDFVYLPSDEETGVTEALVKDRAMLALSDVEFFAPVGVFENNICKPYDDNISYIAPLFFESEGLIYNKEMLSSNGFAVPQTWDDFISIANACKNKDFEFYTYAGSQPDEFVNIFAAALAPVIGSAEMNKLLACDETAWDNDKVTEFANKIDSITKLVVSGSSTKSKTDVMECLENGEALFISGSESELKELNKDGEKYALCNYPSLSGESAHTVSFSEMYIPVEAKEPGTAKDFMKFLYSDTVSDLAKEMLGKTVPTSDSMIISPEFAVKSGANQTLSDEFCNLIVDIFKGNIKAAELKDKMLEYIEEF